MGMWFIYYTGYRLNHLEIRMLESDTHLTNQAYSKPLRFQKIPANA
jgi:hypothetical protein